MRHMLCMFNNVVYVLCVERWTRYAMQHYDCFLTFSALFWHQFCCGILFASLFASYLASSFRFVFNITNLTGFVWLSFSHHIIISHARRTHHQQTHNTKETSSSVVVRTNSSDMTPPPPALCTFLQLFYQVNNSSSLALDFFIVLLGCRNRK